MRSTAAMRVGYRMCGRRASLARQKRGVPHPPLGVHRWPGCGRRGGQSPRVGALVQHVRPVVGVLSDGVAHAAHGRARLILRLLTDGAVGQGDGVAGCGTGTPRCPCWTLGRGRGLPSPGHAHPIAGVHPIGDDRPPCLALRITGAVPRPVQGPERKRQGVHRSATVGRVCRDLFPGRKDWVTKNHASRVEPEIRESPVILCLTVRLPG